MRRTIGRLREWALSRGRAWRLDDRGQIAILFGLSLTGLMLAVGGGVDLTRAFSARQKLSQVATLACQYARRPSVIQTIAPSYSGTNGSATYQSNVNAFITNALNAQVFPYSQTNGNPFTFTVGGAADVNVAASVPTTFLKLARVTQMSVGATSHCYDSSATINQTVPNGNSSYMVQEGFETSSCGGTCYTFYSPSGTNTTPSSPQNTFPSSPGYTGATGGSWYIMGYCIEIDSVNVIKSSVPEGFHSAELDCDNGSGSAGNSSISTKVYLPYGNYELRYNYTARVDMPAFNPIYICGSAAADLNWVNGSTTTISNQTRTNQINAYLDLNTAGSAPLHTTFSGTQQLAGSNLIDSCVYATNWVERSVRIFVTTPGYYWLSFAADGQNDSYGGQLDNIRLCAESCTDTLDDNFPSTWLAANNGGVNKILFEDTFESPTYSQDYPYHWITKGGNLNLSLGTSGAASSGWPNQGTSGWITAPYNQINYGLKGAVQGNQHILLDGYNSNGTTNRNRLVSRPFNLVPGYYQLDYNYISIVDFSPVGVYGTFCYSAPASGYIFPGVGGYTPLTGTIRYYNTFTSDGSTNIVGAFMSHSLLVSTPIGGGALNSATSYNNPDGSVSTTPTVPPDKVNWASYDATAVNPVLDTCGYADSYRWIPRSAAIKIVKSGDYWLTFSANGGTADGNGGGIDDVKLTALGSLAMASPPASPVAIPVVDPQPGTKTYFTGFYIIADPLIPPAPLQ